MEVKNQAKLNFLNSITKNNNMFKYMYGMYTIPNGKQRDFRVGIIYDKLISHISKKETIDSVNNIFKYYNTYTSGKKVTGRKILTAYIITISPEHVLSIKKEELTAEKSGYKYQIYDVAKKLILCINDISTKKQTDMIEDLTKCIDQYTEHFDIFIKLDEIKSVNELINQWCDTMATIEEVEKSEKYKNNAFQKKKTIKVVTNTLKKIEKYIKMFDKNYDLSKLKKYYDLKEMVTKNMKKAFYNKLEEDIENEKYEHLEELLKEISNQILMLQTNSPRMQEDFKEKFDIDLIKQMIEHNAFGGEEFIVYTNYVVNCLIQLEAPIKVRASKEKWKEMQTKIVNGEIGGFGKVVPYVFRFIYDLITEIKDDIISCDVMTSLGLDIFQIK